MAKKNSNTDGILRELRAFGLAYPGAHSKSPWPGHDDLAVNDKTFAYLSPEGEPLGIGCKLPHSNALALMLPGASPTAYGLGKSGWVSLELGNVPAARIDVDMLKAWIDESYRAQAPRKLVKELDARAKPESAKAAATTTATAKARAKAKARVKAAPRGPRAKS